MTSEFYVYCWTNLLNGKQYVGKGKGYRAGRHITDKRSVVSHAIAKYGLENFRLELVEGCLTEDAAFELEAQTVRERGSLAPAGYNLTPGGEGRSGPTSPENAARLRTLALGRRAGDEERARRSAGQLEHADFYRECAKRRGPERTSMTGKKHTPETKAKMAAAQRARWALRGQS
jgi:group I intron endonuclease